MSLHIIVIIVCGVDVVIHIRAIFICCYSYLCKQKHKCIAVFSLYIKICRLINGLLMEGSSPEAVGVNISAEGGSQISAQVLSNVHVGGNVNISNYISGWINTQTHTMTFPICDTTLCYNNKHL